MKQPICPSAKNGYITEQDALYQIQLAKDTRQVKLYSYFCLLCKHWHLSSQNRK